MKFRPCIDIHQGAVKQIVGGTLTGELVENFVSKQDAAYFAGLFKEDGLTGGHVIMLGPGNEAEALKALKTYPGGLQIGGGITAENAAFYLDQGASQVIVTSYVFRDGAVSYQNLDRMIAEVGRENLVLDLSCRMKNGTYYVATDRWQKLSDVEITSPNLNELARYCAEFLVHAVDVEGLRRGIDEDLVSRLAESVPIPTTYAGGARSIADLDLVKRLGNDKVDLTIGSALNIFGGGLSYRDVVEWNKKNN